MPCIAGKVKDVEFEAMHMEGKLMWIAAQHGDDGLHLWVVDAAGVTGLHAASDRGQSFEQQVGTLARAHLPDDTVTLVVCAGAPGASFAQVPSGVLPAQQINSSDVRLAVFALPRLVQAQPVDALQGDEATVAGFVAQYPEWDGVLCLTGPSTRWVHISAGEVVSFRSFMTGEMFGLLAEQSSLQEALAGKAWDSGAFDLAVSDAMSRPERLGSTMASLRAQALFAVGQSGAARAQLSGTLIGAELAAARPYWLGQNVALIGEGRIVECYGAALKGQGAMMERHAAREMALRGLQGAYDTLRRN